MLCNDCNSVKASFGPEGEAARICTMCNYKRPKDEMYMNSFIANKTTRCKNYEKK